MFVVLGSVACARCWKLLEICLGTSPAHPGDASIVGHHDRHHEEMHDRARDGVLNRGMPGRDALTVQVLKNMLGEIAA